jgi:hypothetical protein
MRFEIEYASTRREVWDWYWRFWRERGWKTHALIFPAVGAAALVGSYAGGHGKLSPIPFLFALEHPSLKLTRIRHGAGSFGIPEVRSRR